MEFEFTVFLDGGEEVTTTEWVSDVDERMEDLREQYGEDCHAVRAKPINQDECTSEIDSKSVGIEQTDLMLATGALQVTIEIGTAKGHPMEGEKLALSRLKAALGVTV